MRRRYVDPPNVERCSATILMADGSLAQCGRRKACRRNECWQHAAPDEEKLPEPRFGDSSDLA